MYPAVSFCTSSNPGIAFSSPNLSRPTASGTGLKGTFSRVFMISSILRSPSGGGASGPPGTPSRSLLRNRVIKETKDTIAEAVMVPATSSTPMTILLTCLRKNLISNLRVPYYPTPHLIVTGNMEIYSTNTSSGFTLRGKDLGSNILSSRGYQSNKQENRAQTRLAYPQD